MPDICQSALRKHLPRIRFGSSSNLTFFGPVRLCRAVLPHMRERRSGLIVHVSSIVGRVLFPACAFYCASKFALEAYAEVLHYELTGLGIDSVLVEPLVEPGPFPTHLLANSAGPLDQERARGYGQLPRCANSSWAAPRNSLHLNRRPTLTKSPMPSFGLSTRLLVSARNEPSVAPTMAPP